MLLTLGLLVLFSFIVFRKWEKVPRMALVLILVGAILLAFADRSKAETVVISGPDQGVVFEQIDFMFPAVEMADSSWGRITANANILSSKTGISRGYLNVFTDAGWVVDNLLVDVNGPNPVTAYFTLGLDDPNDPEEVVSLWAHIEFSDTPESDFKDGSRTLFPVGDARWNAQGGGDEDVTKIDAPPPVRYIPPAISKTSDGSGEEECLQSDAENVQTAVNQCAPMAVANGLQFQENSTSIEVPNDHLIGLRPDDSLVGQLDETMDRAVTDRSNGSGVWFEPMLQGKFEYLVDNGLDTEFEIKHQGRGYGETIPDGDFEYMGITSVDNGDTVTWEFICDEICNGEDVVLIYKHSTGGHAVRVVGCGTTEDKKWIMYAHDRNQSNDTDGLETVQVNLEDLDSDGTLNLGSVSREIVFVLSESVINEPPVCDLNGPYEAECAGSTTTVALDGTGSYDPDPGDTLTYAWTTDCPSGSFDDPTSATPLLTVDSSPGCYVECNVALTVTDDYGESDSCSTTVTITDTLAPSITCPPDLPDVEQTSADGTPVDLGDPVVFDACDEYPEVTNDAPALFPLGETIVTWTVTDDCNHSSSCTQAVTVVDTTPPEILSLTASPDNLWPPNHKMVPVTITCVCEDICDIAPVSMIISVESSQPVNGKGDGNTEPDWEITGDLSVDLRSERAGNDKAGRIYTIMVSCTDFSGNSSTATVDVIVPHDQGKKSGKSNQGSSSKSTAYSNNIIPTIVTQGVSIATPSQGFVQPVASMLPPLIGPQPPVSVVLNNGQGNKTAKSNQGKGNNPFTYGVAPIFGVFGQGSGIFPSLGSLMQQSVFGNGNTPPGYLQGNHWGWNLNFLKPQTNPGFSFSSNASYWVPPNFSF